MATINPEVLGNKLIQRIQLLEKQVETLSLELVKQKKKSEEEKQKAKPQAPVEIRGSLGIICQQSYKGTDVAELQDLVVRARQLEEEATYNNDYSAAQVLRQIRSYRETHLSNRQLPVPQEARWKELFKMASTPAAQADEIPVGSMISAVNSLMLEVDDTPATITAATHQLEKERAVKLKGNSALHVQSAIGYKPRACATRRPPPVLRAPESEAALKGPLLIAAKPSTTVVPPSAEKDISKKEPAAPAFAAQSKKSGGDENLTMKKANTEPPLSTGFGNLATKEEKAAPLVTAFGKQLATGEASSGFVKQPTPSKEEGKAQSDDKGAKEDEKKEIFAPDVEKSASSKNEQKSAFGNPPPCISAPAKKPEEGAAAQKDAPSPFAAGFGNQPAGHATPATGGFKSAFGNPPSASVTPAKKPEEGAAVQKDAPSPFAAGFGKQPASSGFVKQPTPSKEEGKAQSDDNGAKEDEKKEGVAPPPLNAFGKQLQKSETDGTKEPAPGNAFPSPPVAGGFKSAFGNPPSASVTPAKKPEEGAAVQKDAPSPFAAGFGNQPAGHATPATGGFKSAFGNPPSASVTPAKKPEEGAAVQKDAPSPFAAGFGKQPASSGFVKQPTPSKEEGKAQSDDNGAKEDEKKEGVAPPPLNAFGKQLALTPQNSDADGTKEPAAGNAFPSPPAAGGFKSASGVPAKKPEDGAAQPQSPFAGGFAKQPAGQASPGFVKQPPVEASGFKTTFAPGTSAPSVVQQEIKKSEEEGAASEAPNQELSPTISSASQPSTVTGFPQQPATQTPAQSGFNQQGSAPQAGFAKQPPQQGFIPQGQSGVQSQPGFNQQGSPGGQQQTETPQQGFNQQGQAQSGFNQQGAAPQAGFAKQPAQQGFQQQGVQSGFNQQGQAGGQQQTGIAQPSQPGFNQQGSAPQAGFSKQPPQQGFSPQVQSQPGFNQQGSPGGQQQTGTPQPPQQGFNQQGQAQSGFNQQGAAPQPGFQQQAPQQGFNQQGQQQSNFTQQQGFKQGQPVGFNQQAPSQPSQAGPNLQQQGPQQGQFGKPSGFGIQGQQPMGQQAGGGGLQRPGGFQSAFQSQGTGAMGQQSSFAGVAPAGGSSQGQQPSGAFGGQSRMQGGFSQPVGGGGGFKSAFN